MNSWIMILLLGVIIFFMLAIITYYLNKGTSKYWQEVDEFEKIEWEQYLKDHPNNDSDSPQK